MAGPFGNDDKRLMAHLDDPFVAPTLHSDPLLVYSQIRCSLAAGMCVVHLAGIFMWPPVLLQCALCRWLLAGKSEALPRGDAVTMMRRFNLVNVSFVAVCVVYLYA